MGRVAKDDGGGSGLESLAAIGPGLARPAAEGGVGMSPEQLVEVARRGGSPSLEALRDVGTTLWQMRVSPEQLTALSVDWGKGLVVRAIASKSMAVSEGRVSTESLIAAGLQRHGALKAVYALGH